MTKNEIFARVHREALSDAEREAWDLFVRMALLKTPFANLWSVTTCRAWTMFLMGRRPHHNDLMPTNLELDNYRGGERYLAEFQRISDSFYKTRDVLGLTHKY